MTREEFIQVAQQANPPFAPQDLFSNNQLADWAGSHGLTSLPLMVATAAHWLVWAAIALVAIILLCGSFFTVDQQHVGVVERFGKFVRTASAGLRLKWPLIESVVDRVSMRTEELVLDIGTKTLDNVIISIQVAVQHRVIPGNVYSAYYELTDVAEQMKSYVINTIYAHVPKMKLDDVYSNQQEIADQVKGQLSEVMAAYGYEISAALVVSLDPDAKVAGAMNAINAAVRNREAAAEQGEAQRIITVKNAEAEAESKKLQGEGIANQRKAIIDGLRASVEEFKESTDVPVGDVMSLIMVTQYFDTLKEIGKHGTTIMLPHGPGAVSELRDQLMAGMLAIKGKVI